MTCKTLRHRNFRYAVIIANQKCEPFVPFDNQELQWLRVNDLPWLYTHRDWQFIMVLAPYEYKRAYQICNNTETAVYGLARDVDGSICLWKKT